MRLFDGCYSWLHGYFKDIRARVIISLCQSLYLIVPSMIVARLFVSQDSLTSSKGVLKFIAIVIFFVVDYANQIRYRTKLPPPLSHKLGAEAKLGYLLLLFFPLILVITLYYE